MSNSHFNQFTGLYSLSKTLRFELRPVGKTLENMRNRVFVDKNGNNKKDYDPALQTFLKDQSIEDAYQYLKPYFDKLHEEFITDSLNSDTARRLDFSDYLAD
jgi:CRISPR-associated protein Cpf1